MYYKGMNYLVYIVAYRLVQLPMAYLNEVIFLSLALPKKVKPEDIGALTDETLDTKKPE